MAAILIESSPPRQFNAIAMSSSPALPPLDEIVKKRRQIWAGSRAAPVPQSASASFTSAAALFKATTNPGTIEPKPGKTATKKPEDGESKAPRKAAAGKAGEATGESKKPRKARAKVGDENLNADPSIKVARPRKKKAEKEENGEGAPKEKPVRKPRAKKQDGDTQTQLAKGKVTKSSTGNKSTKTKKLPVPKEDSMEEKLSKAVKRRLDWTPPAASNTTNVTPATISLLDMGFISGGSAKSEEKPRGFTDLFGSFGFTKGNASSVELPVVIGEGTRKRKLIELVKTSVATTLVAPNKEKTVKKKARTLTDQATSAYAEEESPEKAAPLMQYFAYETNEGATTDGFKVPSKPRARSPVKGNPKPKKGSVQAPILLSPASAMKQVGSQDFVFGTSSQLAREESPTLLRDLHEAMQASNKIGDDPFADWLEDSAPLNNNRRLVKVSGGSLWSAATRDARGNLLDVEMVDLSESPALARTARAGNDDLLEQKEYAVWRDITSSPPLPGESNSSIEHSKLRDEATPIIGDDCWVDVGSSPILTRSQIPMPAAGIGPIEAAIRTELLTSPSKLSTQISQPSKPDPAPSQTKKSKSNKPKSTVTEMPNYTSYTTAQLAKEISSYRFKPIKGRGQMITLLEKCWEGKQRAALGALDANFMVSAPLPSKVAPPSETVPASPKPPRGRPRKDSISPPSKVKAKAPRKRATTVEDLEMPSDTPLSQIRTPKKGTKPNKSAEEIEDSDSPTTPSPPRRLASQVNSPQLALQLSCSEDEIVLSPNSNQQLLFTHITSAVKGCTPSKDIKSPSWHEKILLYDPIIIEDLALWLNTGALGKCGWDGEVDAKEVKKWCESKSICCLWKENLRGGTRSRY